MAGCMAIAVVAGSVIETHRTSPSRPGTSTAPTVTNAADGVTVTSAIYEPAQSSEWHRHDRVHVVTVLSGILTIYEGDCRARTYGPGDSYIGGQDAHMARNETSEPVRMTVTQLMSPATSGHPRTLLVEAPPGGPSP